MSLNFKNEEEGHRASFLVFWAHSKAVSLNAQADLIDFSQNTRGKTKYGLVVMDVFTREAAVEPLQNKNAETVGRATKRAVRELTGDDGNFVVTTDLGNEFATLDRELPEAVHRTSGPRTATPLPWWTGASRR